MNIQALITRPGIKTLMKDPVTRRVMINPITATLASSLGRILSSSVRSFVFVASTGRCGTNTLQCLCTAVPRCVSLHEPNPCLRGPAYRALEAGDPSKMRRAWRLTKLPSIYLAAALRLWYVETNMMFIRAFPDLAVQEFGPRLQVVHLVRDARAVARSFLHRHSIPGPTDYFKPDPMGKHNVIKIADVLSNDDRFSHDYFKCLWYWYETEARVRDFRSRYPGVAVHDLKTEDLNSMDAALSLFEHLGMEVDADRLAKVVGVRANRSGSEPEHPSGVRQDDVDAFEAICQQRLRAGSRQGPWAIGRVHRGRRRSRQLS